MSQDRVNDHFTYGAISPAPLLGISKGRLSKPTEREITHTHSLKTRYDIILAIVCMLNIAGCILLRGGGNLKR